MHVVFISYCFYTALFNRMLLRFLTVELWLVVAALFFFLSSFWLLLFHCTPRHSTQLLPTIPTCLSRAATRYLLTLFPLLVVQELLRL